jgi:hypothetical protein
MTPTRRNVRPIATFLPLAGAVVLALSACGSEPTATEPSREAGNLGTRVCVVNNTSLEAYVTFTKKDTAQAGATPAVGRVCGEGTFGVGDDVVGQVSWVNPVWVTEFSATNPWMGSPSAFVSEARTTSTFRCAGMGFNVNESLTADNGVVRATVTRLADDQWKEFDIVFTPSANPSADGTPMKGAGFRECKDPRTNSPDK